MEFHDLSVVFIGHEIYRSLSQLTSGGRDGDNKAMSDNEVDLLGYDIMQMFVIYVGQPVLL